MVRHTLFIALQNINGFFLINLNGTRFDEDMLLQIGTALSILIDMERSATNLEQVTQSRTIQQQLLDLFRNGTDNKNAVSQIMEGITLSIEDEKVLSK